MAHALTPSQRARACIRETLSSRKMTQRDLANLLQWSQSKVAKLLNGQVQLLVDDLAAMAWVLDLRLVECVREPGYEFVADLTPTELRILTQYRGLPRAEQDALVVILRAHETRTPPPMPTYTPKRR